jgi:hypothetical protein
MKLLLSLIFLTFFSLKIYSQIAINNDNSQPDPSSMLDVKSTDSGVLVPRMTSTERNLISNVATGLLVYDTDEKAFMFYDGNRWKKVGDDSDSDPNNEIQSLSGNATEISISGGNSFDLAPLSKSWEFPQGLEGTPIINLDANLIYTVPSGKTLYMTSRLPNVITPDTMAIGSGGVRFVDFNNFYQSSFLPSYPIIPSDTKIKSSFTGVLVNNSSSITPILLFWEAGVANSYTVPPNKKLIIKSGLGTNSLLDFKINGNEVGGFYTNSKDIVILPSNTTISNITFFDLTVLYTGYLVD